MSMIIPKIYVNEKYIEARRDIMGQGSREDGRELGSDGRIGGEEGCTKTNSCLSELSLMVLLIFAGLCEEA